MPSNFGSSDSKWSSERERKERERQRDAQKELMRQARLEREEKEAREAKEAEARATAAAEAEAASQANTAGTGGEETPQRRLSAAEREAIRKLRGEDPEEAAPTETSGGSSGTTTGAGKGKIGRRWRSAVEETSAGAGAALPDLPGDPKGGASRSGGKGITSSRLLIFGAALFVAMAIVAFLPFGPFGGGGSTPTPTATEERIIAPSGTLTVNGTPRAKVTAPSDKNTVVCIDPGHGGWDPGFTRPPDPSKPNIPIMTEAEVNLAMGYMLKERLESEGLTVVMTRTTGMNANINNEDVNGDGKTYYSGSDPDQHKQNGEWDDIQARINVCNKANADIVVSLHINGYGESTASGYEVLYTSAPYRSFGNLNLELATDVYRRMFAMYNSVGYTGEARGTKPDDTLDVSKHQYGSAKNLLLTGPAIDTPDRKLVPSNMPGITIEPLFLTNDNDALFLADPKNVQLLVDAYADGILDYFAKNPG